MTLWQARESASGIEQCNMWGQFIWEWRRGQDVEASENIGEKCCNSAWFRGNVWRIVYLSAQNSLSNTSVWAKKFRSMKTIEWLPYYRVAQFLESCEWELYRDDAVERPRGRRCTLQEAEGEAANQHVNVYLDHRVVIICLKRDPPSRSNIELSNDKADLKRYICRTSK